MANITRVLRYLLTYWLSFFNRFAIILCNVCVCLDYFNICHFYIGRCDGEHAGDLYHDAAGFPDADDLAFDALEGAFLDHHLLAFAELVADLCKVDQVRVEGRGHSDEVFHGLVRDGEGTVCRAVPVVVDRAGVAEAANV